MKARWKIVYTIWSHICKNGDMAKKEFLKC